MFTCIPLNIREIKYFYYYNYAGKYEKDFISCHVEISLCLFYLIA
jgi:hypothetical protein